MKPALSVIIFTVASGAGLGLLVWLLIASTMPEHIRMDFGTFATGVALAFVLITLGLCSSTLHLANPKNARFALSRWRTSWLSREGLLALLLYPATALHLAALVFAWPRLAPWTLGSVILIALGVLFSTGMIYACLRTVPRWHTPLTPTKYVVFGLMSGAVLLPAVLSLRPPEVGPIGRPMMAIAFLITGLLLYLVDLLRHPAPAPTLNDALGFRRGTVRLLDVGHSHGTFLTEEFGFSLARRHTQGLRVLALILAFVVPLALCGFTQAFWLASLSCLTGLLVERWLFFAEAQHVVRLYHGQSVA